MSLASAGWRATALAAWIATLCTVVASGAHAQPLPRSGALERVNRALAMSERGEFVAARQSLEASRRECGSTREGRECRVLVASGLGSLLQRQATTDRRNRDSLYRAAVAYYDTILAEVPDNPEAIYGKALAYRAIGPHEWMEPFFTQAPTRDPRRRTLYLTFLGDYFAAARRWSSAARAYEAAVLQDSDEDGARSGLVDALSAVGPTATSDLLRHARSWELRYPASAAAAYRAVLAFPASSQPEIVRDSAIVGLVKVQTLNRMAVGAVPDSVNPDWTPVREIRRFTSTGRAADAPWWRQGSERSLVLAQAALAGGRAATDAGSYELAERLWREGTRLAPLTSTVTLDLQRELALLYFNRPEVDPNGAKFEALEKDIFSGKAGALASGDLEAAQRYHTTLALIYLQRGVWRSERFAHNAEQQLTWALDKAAERQQRERFHQPLPELKLVLARGLASAGNRRAAAQRYVEAARAFLDVDDLVAADSTLRHATRLGGDADRVMTVLGLRAAVAPGGDGMRSACAPEQTVLPRRADDAGFIDRQRFKLFADCAASEGTAGRQQLLVRAFTLVDSGAVTLVGGADVARFEQVMYSLLAPFGVTFETAHLDLAAQPGGPFVQVSLPGETTRRWYMASLDDVVAARVVAALGSAAQPFPLVVDGGVVSIPSSALVPASLMARLRTIAGVRSVQVGRDDD